MQLQIYGTFVVALGWCPLPPQFGGRGGTLKPPSPVPDVNFNPGQSFKTMMRNLALGRLGVSHVARIASGSLEGIRC